MAPPTPDPPDPRLEQLVELVVQLASGRLRTRMDPSSASDEIDAVIVGINMLAEELEALNEDLEERVAERTQQLEMAQLQLERLALYDPLTDLANRTLLGDRIAQAMAGADRDHAPPAVIVLDLDGFKAVNDSFGHAVGDLLLVEVARRLRGVARRSDTVARLGGDEFALVILDATADQVLDVADRIKLALGAPVLAGDRSCWVSASIGVRFAARDETAGVLLRDADTAMYVAKARGRGDVQVYEPRMHTAALRRVRLADELRAALSSGELRLHYQPIVELATGHTTAVEALVRWQHPVRGLLSADDVIPVAEETGLIVAVDQWVLDAAGAQIAAWRTTESSAARLSVHVNISPITFRSPGFAEEVLVSLARRGVRAADVMLEVTETQMMGEDTQTMAAMDALQAAGVGVAIDDFGAGCSSLGYVRRQLVDVIKIDRSLVAGLDADPSQRRVAAALLAVVDAFGLTAVAEGVQTHAEAAQLRALGCRYGQGFLWGGAVPAAELAIPPDVSFPPFPGGLARRQTLR
ncbi:MAG: EAL domain-containing protein [Pseudonocardiales bacterium]|nr:EAL domain-containing protein [Pseudonocardiales bacterium]